jgi:acetoin utilization protein AcuB
VKITVSDWMTPDPASIEPEASALAAIEMMVGGGYRHLPVVDEAGRVIGILTLSDLRSALEEPLGLHDLPSREACALAKDYTVAELMTYAPTTTAADATLESAAGRLAARRIGCLPVVDDAGALVGMLSETDALRALVAVLAVERGGSSPRTLARLDTVESHLRAERWRILDRLSALGQAGRALADEQREQVLDTGELGTDQQNVELEEQLAYLSARRLDALDRALDRAAQGRLGICDDCGAAIPTARARALPGATVCVRCASSKEAGRARGEQLPGSLAAFRTGIGGQLYTPQGEGRLLRIAPFGTCGGCGEVEGRYDEDEDAILCSSPECGIPLTDVVELAVVQVGDAVISVAPEKLREVDAHPYD